MSQLACLFPNSGEDIQAQVLVYSVHFKKDVVAARRLTYRGLGKGFGDERTDTVDIPESLWSGTGFCRCSRERQTVNMGCIH